MENTKWVSAWGTATSITDRKECVYSKDITLRYPLHMPFDGSKIRLRFSNLTGTEDVVISKAYVSLKNGEVRGDFVALTKDGCHEINIPAGFEVTADELDFSVSAGSVLEVSLYLKNCTQMNAGTLVTGPLSGGTYAYGDFACAEAFPDSLCRNTSWYYFLNTVDVFTSKNNMALCCYGDSITAQDWPDFLQMELEERGVHNVSVIRRAVCGTRILRQYDCITYQAYGLKGETRFPVEMNVAGCSHVIIQHGINDIIHPVGVEVNKFRPMSDMPTLEELCQGVKDLYLAYCNEKGIKAYSGTLLPIYGWRTYAPFRDEIRNSYNQWLRTFEGFAGCVDFDKAVRDEKAPERFAPGFDSGDHLHPSKDAYKAMAHAAADFVIKNIV